MALTKAQKKSRTSLILTIVALLLVIAAIFGVIYSNISTKSAFLKDELLSAFFADYFDTTVRNVSKEDLATVEAMQFGYIYDPESQSIIMALTIGGEGYLAEMDKEEPDTELLQKITKAYNIGGYEFKNLEDLQYCTGLKSFMISGFDGFKNIDFAENFTKLEDLQLMQTGLTDISVISKLTTLKDLAVEYDMYTDISFVENLVNLESLNLTRNQITDLTPVANLTKLTSLNLSANTITDLSPLANLHDVTYLDISSNGQLADISVLKNMPKLETLYAGNNFISDASVIKELPELTMIYFESNQLADVSAFTELDVDKIHSVSLSLNDFITDWSPLDYLGDKLTGRPTAEEEDDDDDPNVTDEIEIVEE